MYNKYHIINTVGQRGDDELAIQIMYLLYQLMCHPITGDYIIQNTGMYCFQKVKTIKASYFIKIFLVISSKKLSNFFINHNRQCSLNKQILDFE